MTRGNRNFWCVPAGGFGEPGEGAKAERGIAENLDLSGCPDPAALLVVNGADPALSMYLEPILRFHAPDEVARLTSVRALSMVPAAHQLTRVDEDAFTVTILGERSDPVFERVFGAQHFTPGDVVEVGTLTVRIEEVVEGRWR